MKTNLPWALKFLLIALTVSLAACQSPAPPPIIYTERENLEAQQNYKACVISSIKKIDDGMSDAYTIANAAAVLCRSEYTRYIEIQTAGDNDWVKAKVLNELLREHGQKLTPMVLKIRAEK